MRAKHRTGQRTDHVVVYGGESKELIRIVANNMKLEMVQPIGLRVFINGNLFNEHGKVLVDKHALFLDDHIVHATLQFQIPRALIIKVLLINYSNASALEIYCHSLQSYTLVGALASLLPLYDKLCIAHTDLEERLVGANRCPTTSTTRIPTSSSPISTAWALQQPARARGLGEHPVPTLPLWYKKNTLT